MQKNKPKTVLALFFTMLKIGLFTFGGGYAMIALLENEFVGKKGWMEKDDFLDMLAIAESTPGPIAINSATYIGYRLAGVLGSVAATVAVCIPSFVIIYVISLFLDAFLSFTVVQYAFRGIQVCVVYLIGAAGIKMFRGLKTDLAGKLIFGASALAMLLLSLFAVSFSAVFYILIAGVIGILLYFLRESKKKEADK